MTYRNWLNTARRRTFLRLRIQRKDISSAENTESDTDGSELKERKGGKM
jgi:hypothetical protein